MFPSLHHFRLHETVTVEVFVRLKMKIVRVWHEATPDRHTYSSKVVIRPEHNGRDLEVPGLLRPQGTHLSEVQQAEGTLDQDEEGEGLVGRASVERQGDIKLGEYY